MRVACLYFRGEVKLLEFAQACLRFSPQIAVREPDVVFVEIGKCLGLFSEASFVARARVLARRFESRPGSCTVTVHDDLPSALALARHAVSPGQDVGALPLEALEEFADPYRKDPAGRKQISGMIESLRRLGLSSVGQFREIPQSQLPSRFGALALFCRQRLDGAATVAWAHWDPPESYAESLELAPSDYCADLEPLLFLSKAMLDRLFARLRGRFLRIERMRVCLEMERSSVVRERVREWVFEFIAPQGSTPGVLPILRERMGRDLERRPLEALAVALRCEVLATGRSAEGQRQLLGQDVDYDESMGSFFGLMEEFLGREHVFWAQVTEHRYPERSWQRTSVAQSAQVSVEGRYPTRPTRVFPRPVPITVLDDRIRLYGRVYRTSRWSSVERLALDWLDDAPARNYYRVELESGRSALWVFSDPNHHFFVHGYFE